MYILSLNNLTLAYIFAYQGYDMDRMVDSIDGQTPSGVEWRSGVKRGSVRGSRVAMSGVE